MSGRDLDDPATVRLLAERVGTIERLRFLAVATYARIVALGAADKIPWRLDQLWRTYSATQHELLRELETDRIQQVPEDLPPTPRFVKGFPLRYLRAHSSAEIQEHLQLFERSRPTGVAVKLDPLEGAYRITIVARDKPSLFASLRRGDFQFWPGHSEGRSLLQRRGSHFGHLRGGRSETHAAAQSDRGRPVGRPVAAHRCWAVRTRTS